MSESAIFIVGVVIFAITVYGVVMAGGAAFTRIEIEQNPRHEDSLEEENLKRRFPFTKY